MMIHVNGLGYAPQNLARVVVWEWLNEHGRWRPYSAAVCHHIENVLKGDSRGTVVLGQVEPQLAPYIIDLQSMHQFRQDTGTMRPAQRNFYEPSSAPGKGVVWEWENDSGSWTPYDMEICVTIQNAYEKQHPWLDLTSLGFCYLIDFNSMTQTNRQSQRKRRLRRRMDLAYPLTTGSIPKSQSWPVGTSSGQPCSCQQCILVNSTRAASNAILASQRRKVYTGANGAHGTLTLVRQSNTFASTTLWSATSSVSSGSAKPEQNPEDVVKRYMEKVKMVPDEDCTICMERLTTSSGYEGVLSHKGIKSDLVGKLSKCGHIYHLLCLVAMYNNGNKGTDHPNPGKKFSARGFPRHCYLPDLEKGRKVRLLFHYSHPCLKLEYFNILLQRALPY
ncbi:UNVERIFIED_CONTAM: hypothetical protein FKN15_012505 [Acipenser sinensis]